MCPVRDERSFACNREANYRCAHQHLSCRNRHLPHVHALRIRRARANAALHVLMGQSHSAHVNAILMNSGGAPKHSSETRPCSYSAQQRITGACIITSIPSTATQHLSKLYTASKAATRIETSSHIQAPSRCVAGLRHSLIVTHGMPMPLRICCHLLGRQIGGLCSPQTHHAAATRQPSRAIALATEDASCWPHRLPKAMLRLCPQAATHSAIPQSTLQGLSFCLAVRDRLPAFIAAGPSLVILFQL